MPSTSKPERPRDELGRPLPEGSWNRLAADDLDGISAEAANLMAIAHFGAGRYFLAHEAWEAAWVESKGTPSEALFKGLAQMGAGYTHAARGNPSGMRILLERAVTAISGRSGGVWGVDVEALGREIDADLTRIAGLAEGANLLRLEPWALPRS